MKASLTTKMSRKPAKYAKVCKVFVHLSLSDCYRESLPAAALRWGLQLQEIETSLNQETKGTKKTWHHGKAM